MPEWMILLLAMPVVGVIVYTSLDRLMGRLDSKVEMKTVVAELNQVKECGHCGRLSRNYQRELARYDFLLKGKSLEQTGIAPAVEPCPHCKQEATFHSIPNILPFHKHHLDCLPLEVTEYAEHQRQIEECERLLYASKVNESFNRRLVER
ncbi:hypothetical protein [Bacillus sp. FJAT-52991]|uniref:Uncharacterized protein n=1 Tax=Bacillus kandeliae TaxID=3129297 RepID=A0ABZ2N9T1_9BACI